MSSDAAARGWRSQEKKKSHINVSELKSSQIGNNDFYSNKKKGDFHPCQSGQDRSFVLSNENWAHKKTVIVSSSK